MLLLECKTCHLDIVALYLVVNIQLHHTVHVINKGMRVQKGRK